MKILKDDFCSSFSPKGNKNGYVQVQIRDSNGEIIRTCKGKNLITYQGCDVLAKRMSGNDAFKITHLYGEHVPAGTYGASHGLEAARTDTVDSLTDSGTGRMTTGAESQILYPSFNASNTNYQNNIMHFTASFKGTAVENRQFVGAGLVAVVGATKYLFSHIYFPTHDLSANQEIIITWGVEFL